jgi:hypothetical protein
MLNAGKLAFEVLVINIWKQVMVNLV